MIASAQGQCYESAVPFNRYCLLLMLLALLGNTGCAWIKGLTGTGAPPAANPQTQLPPQPAPPSAQPRRDLDLQAIFDADNAALTEVAEWIEQNRALILTDPRYRDQLAQRIRVRLDRVRKLYLAFLSQHPNHARARAAYGSFLTHLDDQQGALRQLQISAELAPFNAAVHNNIATHLGTLAVQSGRTNRVGEALAAYQKAIRLAPRVPLYRHNYGIALSLFRSQAAINLKRSPREVTTEAIAQLTEALRLEPTNFEIAADLAETHHELNPIPREAALAAWKHAATLATTNDQRGWAQLQMAIVNIETGHLTEAKTQLAKVNAEIYSKLKQRLLKAMAEQENPETPPP